MKKMELEIKILDIDKNKFIEKIEKLGGTFKSEVKQYLYTYDLPTIYGRYIDLLTQLNYPESDIKYEVSMDKLKLLFFEIDNFLNDEEKKELNTIIGYNKISELLNSPNILATLNNSKLIEFIKRFHNNSKKWIRVRQTNNKTTIAVKHILADNETNIQQMQETEIEVPNLDEAKTFLEALGYSHKSYQEKQRIIYYLDGYEIDIDTWPLIPTYAEIEGDSQEKLKEIIEKLGYSITQCVSCTADEIYERYGKSMFKERELKFDKIS